MCLDCSRRTQDAAKLIGDCCFDAQDTSCPCLIFKSITHCRLPSHGQSMAKRMHRQCSLQVRQAEAKQTSKEPAFIEFGVRGPCRCRMSSATPMQQLHSLAAEPCSDKQRIHWDIMGQLAPGMGHLQSQLPVHRAAPVSRKHPQMWSAPELKLLQPANAKAMPNCCCRALLESSNQEAGVQEVQAWRGRTRRWMQNS